jgi:signal transduction histidine kinase
MFRIAQEAINNIIRHANARNARVQLTRQESKWVLVVEDDGRGFDMIMLKHEEDGDHHWGLFGVEERAQLFGGTCRVQSTPGQGTVVSVEIPVE